MPESREDDLFRESTMTFGEHLEDLRGCLFRSFAGLTFGFVLGLMVGKYVVMFVQTPLSNALANYYRSESFERVQGKGNEGDAEQSQSLTEDEAKRRVEVDDFLAEEVFIDPAKMFQELKRVYPTQFKDMELPASPTEEPQVEDTKAADREPLIRLLLWHHSKDDPRIRTKSLSAQEAFTVYVKASLLVGILLSSPWVFYQISHFVAAGLYPHERHYVHLYLPFSLGLFLAGAALAFFVVFEPVLNFLFSFNKSLGIDPDPRINEWLGFVLMLPVGFGIGFQLPLVMLFLERIGLFSVEGYLKQWRVAVLVIFVTAALLTPPDPYSMLLLAFPLTLLYFGGIMLCKLLPRRANPFGETSSS